MLQRDGKTDIEPHRERPALPVEANIVGSNDIRKVCKQLTHGIARASRIANGNRCLEEGLDVFLGLFPSVFS
jgi:hypothetical protein